MTPNILLVTANSGISLIGSRTPLAGGRILFYGAAEFRLKCALLLSIYSAEVPLLSVEADEAAAEEAPLLSALPEEVVGAPLLAGFVETVEPVFDGVGLLLTVEVVFDPDFEVLLAALEEVAFLEDVDFWEAFLVAFLPT